MSLFWKILGHGTYNLVLLHGWALNSNIWYFVVKKLKKMFRIYLLDLPGYGKNAEYGPLNIDDIIQEIIFFAPKNAIWLGWSLGGLIAIKIANKKPNIVRGLILVSSSPCFITKNNWPGINYIILDHFSKKLKLNLSKTINNFLKLQLLSHSLNKENILGFKKIINLINIPSNEVLLMGLSILKYCDLRKILSDLNLPILRIYGYLDRLVPYQVIPLIDKLCPKSKSVILNNAAHAVFISHLERFCNILCDFKKEII